MKYVSREKPPLCAKLCDKRLSVCEKDGEVYTAKPPPRNTESYNEHSTLHCRSLEAGSCTWSPEVVWLVSNRDRAENRRERCNARERRGVAHDTVALADTWQVSEAGPASWMGNLSYSLRTPCLQGHRALLV